METRYRIVFSNEVSKRYIPKIDKKCLRIILESIDKRLTTRPYFYGKPLQHEWKNHWSLRVGNYRVIYQIYEKEVVVLVVKISHRRNVY